MEIDSKLIKHIASLARLELTEKEIKQFEPEMEEILNAFSALDEVDTKDTKPSFHTVELKNFMREDKTRPCLTQAEALANAKEKKDGYFKGPMAV